MTSRRTAAKAGEGPGNGEKRTGEAGSVWLRLNLLTLWGRKAWDMSAEGIGNFRIGVDIVQISRIEEALARRPRLRKRLFTAAERGYCESRRRPAQHYAVRFAAKEAIAKALGRSLRWQEVEIARLDRNPPQAILHGLAGNFLAGGRLVISLAHGGEYALACALFERAENP